MLKSGNIVPLLQVGKPVRHAFVLGETDMMLEEGHVRCVAY